MEKEYSNKEKITSLYKFIIEFCKSKQKIICNDSDYKWKYQISDIPYDEENISIIYKDKVKEEIYTDDTIDYLIKVHKPEFEKCPKPGKKLEGWLIDGWDDYKRPANHKEKLEHKNTLDNSIIEENFSDDIVRVNEYNIWFEERQKWAERQYRIETTMNFFTELYMRYVDLQRDSETTELIIANGYLVDKNDEKIYHPVLTKRLNIKFDAKENTIYVLDTDASSELYSELFQVMSDINIDSLTELNSELMKNDYHPMDRNETPEFFKVLAHRLSSDSQYVNNEEETKSSKSRIVIFNKPCLIVRKRIDGTIKAVEQIIKNIEETGYIPSHLIEIVSGGKIEKVEEKEDSVEESLAKVGGESIDILLSKEANREQLEIAERIDKYNAVLVQGPPGTGKTHTIANLVGHFLAYGKSVLVTSYTKKALTVLKDKLPEHIKSLCVSVLDDSNKDMESSIDGITEYMSRTTSSELKKRMDRLKDERLKVINDLASVRRKIFNIINSEYKSIVFNGEEISPSEAANFVRQNKDKLSYINGRVKLYSPLPLTMSELIDLYKSNTLISYDEETELNYRLPNPSDLMEPTGFNKLLNIINISKKKIETIGKEKNWKIQINDNELLFETNFGNFYISDYKEENIAKLKNYISEFKEEQEWTKVICCDGKKGGAHKKRWETLINEIRTTNKINENFVSNYFDKKIVVKSDNNICNYKESLIKLKKILEKKNKLGKLDLIFNNELNAVLSDILINSKQIATKDDCKCVLDYIELLESRSELASLWDNLLAKNGAKEFYDLDKDEPETVAIKWIEIISRYLNWYNNEFKKLKSQLEKANIPSKVVLQTNDLDTDIDQTNKIFDSIQNVLPYLLNACEEAIKIENAKKEIEKTINSLDENTLINSSICINLKKALQNYESDHYLEYFRQLEKVYQKNSTLIERKNLLKKLKDVAPEWADDITNRRGIHGLSTVPNDIQNAWKYKQYEEILDDMSKQYLEDLQKKSQKLSATYRKITELYASVCAWYHLLDKTECDIDMKHALKGWELTVKKIGKATGKNAPKYKAKARELMAQCQNAVPCWIMPLNKAIESLKPGENEFDVIIIDEASQSDISSLAIAYLAKKMIIVGDDKQVSPMAVGVDVDKINALEKMYIKDKIPNSHLYGAKTSLYDIAATTFQPLMLREHFRCIPEIIGFSNMLSYDFKIKPLRDSSDTNLFPSIINYRVQGKRTGKVNKVEAETIVSYIKGCLNLEEYNGKTFGVISLVGDEQVKLIQSLLYKYISPRDIEERKILIGNASNFQGDERDVIFISMVDSSNGNGPLSLVETGVEDAMKKRYNVAVSRARDQLWIINSLDPASDLKPNDIRKRLLDYATNPEAFLIQEKKIMKDSESVFEEQVAKKLISAGYHIIQQYPVGAYRLDIVVLCEKRKVVIECDGERYHSGKDKIKEDMQRQAILERIGWRFIRIRGSQFFRNPDETMQQVFDELSFYKIYPESISTNIQNRTSELFEKVKNESFKFYEKIHQDTNNDDNENILYALSGGSKMEIKHNSFAKNYVEKKHSNSSHVVQNDDKQYITSNMNLNNLSFGESQFKYMVLFCEGISRKDISLYYKVNYVTVKKSLQSVAEKYNSKSIENCIDSFKSEYKNSSKYNEIINQYNKENKIINTENNTHEEITLSEHDINKNDESLIKDLTKNNVKFIDNRKKSGIIWVINDNLNSEVLTEIMKNYDYTYTFERRGSIITENKPAWRIMCK